jgi:hypothetical protein
MAYLIMPSVSEAMKHGTVGRSVIMNGKGHERKRGWPNLMPYVSFDCSSGRIDENSDLQVCDDGILR